MDSPFTMIPRLSDRIGVDHGAIPLFRPALSAAHLSQIFISFIQGHIRQFCETDSKFPPAFNGRLLRSRMSPYGRAP